MPRGHIAWAGGLPAGRQLPVLPTSVLVHPLTSLSLFPPVCPAPVHPPVLTPPLNAAARRRPDMWGSSRSMAGAAFLCPPPTHASLPPHPQPLSPPGRRAAFVGAPAAGADVGGEGGGGWCGSGGSVGRVGRPSVCGIRLWRAVAARRWGGGSDRGGSGRGARPSAAAAASSAAAAAAATPAPDGAVPSAAVNVVGSRAEPAAAAPPAPQLSTLLISCPDKKGVVASLGQLLYGYGCNILTSEQFTDVSCSRYFQRIVFDYSAVHVGAANMAVVEGALSDLAARDEMEWTLSYASVVKRVVLLVSLADHCLVDLLMRVRSGELRCTVAAVVSNHAVLEPVARMFDVPFVHLPIEVGADGDKAAAKAAQEAALEALMAERGVDVVVLARYMQVLSPGFCERHAGRVINIHHGLLPSFTGGRPYHQAHARGVKRIGASAHYVTADLDQGPLIEQDTTRAVHRDSVADLVRKGRDLERVVLARAVRWHLDDRVIIFGCKTVVFDD